MTASDLYALPSSLSMFRPWFVPEAAPWEWVPAIRAALGAVVDAGIPRSVPAAVSIHGTVFIHPTARLPRSCHIEGPAWIGADTEIREGALIRGGVITGEGCVLGNSCEFRNALLLDRVQVPHFSYVGDSVLGNRAHLGAGVICSNLRLDRQPVRVRLIDGTAFSTGLRKLGACVGDDVEVGCNAVLQPGTILGRRVLVHPLTAVSGTLTPDMMARPRHVATEVVPRPRP